MGTVSTIPLNRWLSNCREQGNALIEAVGLSVTLFQLSLAPNMAYFWVSGLHPSVHKADMSVWTGSVFE